MSTATASCRWKNSSGRGATEPTARCQNSAAGGAAAGFGLRVTAARGLRYRGRHASSGAEVVNWPPVSLWKPRIMNAPLPAYVLPEIAQRETPAALVDALKARFGAQFSAALVVREQHGRDESSFAAPPPSAVVFAESTLDVSDAIRLAAPSRRLVKCSRSTPCGNDSNRSRFQKSGRTNSTSA